ncbi:P-loop NTPase fold protein [Streptomyces sp. NPDC001401]|uniref:P-loop NTPase fold protein n=1 Tax=Streptomyces sp. NPDC001401 TaxID=3364570 RepID=UPI0036A29525
MAAQQQSYGAAGNERPEAARRFSLLSDEPLDDAASDLLGAQRAAGQLAGLLLTSRPSTPFTLAVDAGWGMGKSSLMRLVEAELRAAGAVETVWYNAWTSTGADALEGLIKSVLLRLDRRVLRRSLARMSERRALVRVVRSVLLLLAGPLGVAGLVDELWRSMSVDSAARNEMRDAIRELTEEWAQTAGEVDSRRMIVVFIDDLDRCSEETVLAVCEAVKVYLDVPWLAFVIGCDRSALGPNGLLRDLSPAGSAFMEKIFQTSYRIPAADSDGIKEYIRSCAGQAGIAGDLDEELIGLLAERSSRNPRRIKRLINGLVLEATLNPTWESFGYGAMVRTLLLQYFYGDFYRMMTGTLGGVELHAVEEFREYAQVRLDLRGPMPESLPERVRRYLVRNGIAVDPARWLSALETVESRLPAAFPELAADPAFTALIDDFMAQPNAEELVERLREGVPVLLAGGEEIEAPHPPAGGVPLISERIDLVFIGVPASGKTTLMAHMVNALQSGASRRGYILQPADPDDERWGRDVRNLAVHAAFPPATRATTRQSMLLKAGRTERLLTIVDVTELPRTGQHASGLSQWVSGRTATTVVLVLDPVRLVARERQADSLPGDVVPPDQTEFFRSWADPARSTGVSLHEVRLAVVLSKADRLVGPDQLAENFNRGSWVRNWAVEELGLESLISFVELEFRQVEYFFTSAVTPDAGGVHSGVVALTDWCIG